jgi:hypothetical protein
MLPKRRTALVLTFNEIIITNQYDQVRLKKTKPYMAEEKKNLHDWASMAEIGSFILNISGVLLPLMASLALSVQKESPVIPVVNLQLGMWFQTTLLICSLLLWLQFIRNFWVANIEKKALNKTYWRFFIYEMIVRFPSLFAPFVIILSSLAFVNLDFIIFVIIIIFILGIALMTNLSDQQNDNYYYNKWNESKDYRDRWVNRILKILEKKKLVETEDFIEFGLNPVTSWAEINDVISIYFQLYETELNLRKSPTKIIENTIEKRNIFGKSVKVVISSYRKTSIWVAQK